MTIKDDLIKKMKEEGGYLAEQDATYVRSASDFQGIYTYRPICSADRMIHAESDIIKQLLGVNYTEVIVINFREDSGVFRKALTFASDLSCERNFEVSGSRWRQSSNNCYKIPGTDIVVLNRDYGFVIRKCDYDAVKNFVITISLSPSSYNDSALDKVYWDEKTSSLKNDVKFFAKSKSWFDKRDLPYSRSYLLYGTPGNGKTSAIRAISKFFGVETDQFSFTGRYEDPDRAFLNWVSGQPDGVARVGHIDYPDCPDDHGENYNPKIRILLLEDIDRFFSREEGMKTPVSLSAMLNALDGLDQRRNSILVATANNPEKIDSQVLLRPGRFDLRIPFDAPDNVGIATFLRQLAVDDNISENTIEVVADMSRGHSFAFVKGVYMAAANKAFSRASEIINDEDIKASLNEFINNMGKDIKSLKTGAGFQGQR